jgi:hypothetical protein
MDYLFIKYKKIKPKYSFQKFFIQPLIDPNLLPKGIIMMGYDGRNIQEYFVIANKNMQNIWTDFDPFHNKNCGIVFLNYDFLYELYGNHINRIAKKNLKNLLISSIKKRAVIK